MSEARMRQAGKFLPPTESSLTRASLLVRRGGPPGGLKDTKRPKSSPQPAVPLWGSWSDVLQSVSNHMQNSWRSVKEADSANAGECSRLVTEINSPAASHWLCYPVHVLLFYQERLCCMLAVSTECRIAHLRLHVIGQTNSVMENCCHPSPGNMESRSGDGIERCSALDLIDYCHMFLNLNNCSSLPLIRSGRSKNIIIRRLFNVFSNHLF